MLLGRLETAPDMPVETLDATVVFVDISGFTKLSERLARSGKEGAEHLTDAINTCFTALLADAYAAGGALLKFGGDALLVWFGGEHHPERACTAAVAMRRTLRQVGRIRAGRSEVTLRMSVGVHSGDYQLFLVGGSHREYVLGGPAASEVVGMEALADPGQILVSAATANRLPERCRGAASGPGVVLARAPEVTYPPPVETPGRPGDDAVAKCLSTEIRAHVRAAPAAPEHRTATIAFLQFGKLDETIVEAGPEAAAMALDRLVRVAQDAADRYRVCFLGSDVTGGGGKLIFSAGAPCAVGDDEERMLLALRQIVDAELPLPVKIGVNRGPVFAGEIGPPYRRTYTVMGDTVNLAARLMAKAPPGRIYATRGVLDRSRTQFETTELEPFSVKGKSQPVEAWDVGPACRAVHAQNAKGVLPLVGREQEVAALRQAVARAEAGMGTLVEIVGETGSGKSRLLSEVREMASELRFVHTTCETYTQETSYVGWRDPLRQLLDLSWEDSDEVVLTRLRGELEAQHPDLLPWLPLLAIAIDADAPPTPEVQQLAPGARVATLHEVVLQFLAPAFEIPTLVEIEHAHVMDEASAALLSALAKRIDSTAWAVVVTRRDVDGGGFVAPDGDHVRLELGPLTPEETVRLAEASPEAEVVPPYVVQLAVERSGGSPEFLLDLLAAAAGGSESLPDSVDAAATARIDALDPGDRALVRRAAVLGLSFHSGRLRDVLEDDEPEPDTATWTRLGSVFARDPDGHVRFKRPALREAAYEGLPFRTRRALHAAVAASLEQELGRDADADPAVLSLHFIRAGDNARAFEYARLGAERATSRFSHGDAARLYRRAIDAGWGSGIEPEQLAAVWERLGLALRRTGEPKAAAEAFSVARRLFGDRSPLDEVRLLYRHARVAERRGGLTAAVRWVNRGLRALERLEPQDAQAWRARLGSVLAGIRMRQGRLNEAASLSRSAIDDAEATGELRALAHACYILDYSLIQTDRPAEATYSPRALEIYRRLGDPEKESRVLNNLGAFAHFEGNWDEAIDLYQQAGACSVRAGNVADAAYTDCNIGEILSDQGHLADAAEYLRRAIRIWRSTGDEQGVAWVKLLLGRLEVRASRQDNGVALIREAFSELASMRLDADANLAVALLAEAELFGGHAARALELADGVLSSPYRNTALIRRVRGFAYQRLGRVREAELEFAASLEAARQHRSGYDIAAALQALDVLGPPDPARSQELVAMLERTRIVHLPTPAMDTDYLTAV